MSPYLLTKLVGGRRVALEEHGLDFHGRTLATVYVRHSNAGEWLNVNEQMVMRGHAWVMRAYYDHLPKDRQAKLDRLETWAKSKKAGLWSTQNPTPPWEWRKNGVPPADNVSQRQNGGITSPNFQFFLAEHFRALTRATREHPLQRGLIKAGLARALGEACVLSGGANSELIQLTALLPLTSMFSSLSAALYQLRNRRLQVFGVDWKTAGEIRASVTTITLLSAGTMAIEATRGDVPMFFLTVVPALFLGYTVATLYDRLHARDTFHRDRFWEITVSPCLSALAPISQSSLKALTVHSIS